MCRCSPAPRAAAPGFGATAFLDRQRGVVATAAPPAATSGRNAGEPTRRRVHATEVLSAEPARKRGRHDGFEHAVVVDAAASSALQVRMDKELIALQGLLKRAKILPRSGSAPPAKNMSAPAPGPSEAPVVSSAAKRKALPSKSSTATEAAYAPAKQQRPVMQRAAATNPIAPEVPSKQRPAEAPVAAKQQQQHPVQRAAAARTEVPKKRRPEEEKEKEKEIARAREEFRQMLLEMEKSALPDETIYPEELEQLGIPFEFMVTRTRKQALLEYHAKKVELAIV